ncbi:MAG TPA: tripartite tricarboxylate transporter substrate binding protein [Xanthobacteraceae bacterium]|nr:tripartite tricarboxylate transporter substrate binding protein [Xanthobacteraceae bacterium]
MTLTRRNVLAGAAATPLALSGLPAFGQAAWPARDIHVICGYAPGTGADILVRYFTEKLRPYTKQNMIVENKAGAGTTIAAEYVARSKPDGYTLFINPGNGMANNPYLYKNLPHDVIKDFSHVTTLVKLPFVLAVAANSPINNIEDFLKAMKEKGEKASYGYPNNISLAAGELLKQRTGMKAVQVAYKSTPEALNDMNNGMIDFLWSDATFGIAQARGGKMKLLAVTPNQRSALAPDLPTLQESGVPNFHLEAWWGAWYAANTPRPIVEQTAKWLNDILASEDTKKFLSTSAPADPFPGTPESALEYLKQDIPRWTEVYELAKIPRQ